MADSIQPIVLAAGRGTRMVSDEPKVLHRLFDRPLLDYPLATVEELGLKKPVVVVGWGRERVATYLNGRARWVVQHPQRGTGHAALVAQATVQNSHCDLLVWPADMALVEKKTIQRLIHEHRKVKAAATVLSSFVLNPTGYGRIVRRAGQLMAIREELDATPAERRIQEVNTGVYVFEPQALFESLKKIKPTNRKKEYYLTDTVRLIHEAGGRTQALPYASREEAHGINSQADLSRAFTLLNQRTLRNLQMSGVTILAPEQTFIGPDVRIGPGTVVYPWSYIEGKVRIGRDCQIGPFAKIRSGSVIGEGATIGSFVEVVRSKIGKGVCAKHLSYLGDATIGDFANVGAGTVTANYDGKRKNKTRIGKKALIGVNTVLIAPVQVGDGARTGAGAVLTRGTRVRPAETYAGVPARPLKGRRNS